MSKLNETIAAAVKTVLDSAPEGMGERNREWNRERLELGTEFGSYASFDFEREWAEERGRGSVSLTLSMEEEGKTMTVGDSILAVSVLKVTLNWPAYGSCTPALARKRIEMMMEFVAFAERLQSLHGQPVHEVIDTVTARDERAREHQAKMAKQATVAQIQGWLREGEKTRFQQVNKPRFFPMGEIPGVTEGTVWEAGLMDKKFQVNVVTVKGVLTGCICRIS
jgi:hypothetical protein